MCDIRLNDIIIIRNRLENICSIFLQDQTRKISTNKICMILNDDEDEGLVQYKQ